MVCPQCHNDSMHRVRRTWLQRRTGYHEAYRCSSCGTRQAIRLKSPLTGPRCWRCKGDLDRARRSTAVDHAMRALGLRPYTCRLCGKQWHWS